MAHLHISEKNINLKIALSALTVQHPEYEIPVVWEQVSASKIRKPCSSSRMSGYFIGLAVTGTTQNEGLLVTVEDNNQTVVASITITSLYFINSTYDSAAITFSNNVALLKGSAGYTGWLAVVEPDIQEGDIIPAVFVAVCRTYSTNSYGVMLDGYTLGVDTRTMASVNLEGTLHTPYYTLQEHRLVTEGYQHPGADSLFQPSGVEDSGVIKYQMQRIYLSTGTVSYDLSSGNGFCIAGATDTNNPFAVGMAIDGMRYSFLLQSYKGVANYPVTSANYASNARNCIALCGMPYMPNI